MKKIFFILLLLYAGNLFAIDRYVNPNLSSGNGTTIFITITSAVNASVNGDRILIVAGTYNEPTLVLNKSLTLIPQTAGSYINFGSNISVAGFPGMKLEVLGFDLGIYSVSSSVITGGVGNNRAKVSFIGCKMNNLSVDADYYELNCLKSTMSGTTTFRFGHFVVSKTVNLTITDEPNSNILTGRIFIVADTVTNTLQFSNDDYKFIISNCLLKNIQILQWNTLTSISNKISNNEFITGTRFLVAKNPPNYNLIVSSNLFSGTYEFYASNNPSNPCCEGAAGNWGQGVCWGLIVNCCAASCISGYSSSGSIFPTPSSSGFFEWTYNGVDLPCAVPSGTQPLALLRVIGTTGTTLNTGNPNHDYYDIDLSVNDRGRTGGPYSILNYNPSVNPSNGKAYIFDLEIPADLFPGIQVDVKAKGYHNN
jgi:hypothetical protein